MVRLNAPARGIPPALYTPDEFQAAADALAAGTGPIAIDTERAGNYRYDDRAFLLQLRRADTDTFLIAPEGHRDAVAKILGPVINGKQWILHSARNDLPCLAWLGLHPGELFDTEVASRLAGFRRPSLLNMMDQLLDLQIDKAHSMANWSAYPLPKSWLAYAALDVEHLIELAEELEFLLEEDGYLEWAEEEFRHIVELFKGPCEPEEGNWRSTKGMGSLRSSQQLAVARALWFDRDESAKAMDASPFAILPNKTLIEAARTLPDSYRDVTRLPQFPRDRPGAAEHILKVIDNALDTDPTTWPDLHGPAPSSLPKQLWKNNFSNSWSSYQNVRDEIAGEAEELDLQVDLVIEPHALTDVFWAFVHSALTHPGVEAKDSVNTSTRKLIDRVEPLSLSWLSPTDIEPALATAGVRPWQRRIVTPILRRRLFP
ncbi:Ribonuclease D [Corynebacterium endometrii]|uniref:Ribonuclease D n=1 Tax=Corynebacterium endometrii TaxID=2488819 RepID=A0A4P7QFR6_9CORY|nr:Ribonuclease D [Corynebacterium endometrii]